MQTTRYSEDKPFGLHTARELEGREAHVTVRRDGLTHTYVGVVRPLTRLTTFVGDDVLLNDGVVAVSVPGLPESQTQGAP